MNCKICGNPTTTIVEDGRDFFIFGGKSDRFYIKFCPSCKIGFTYPDMSDEELCSHYPNEFEAFIPKKSFSSFIQKIKYYQDIRYIKKFSPNSKKLFEIGAGRGEFLFEASRNGFIVSGVEPGRKGIEVAKKFYNINLEYCFADKVTFTEKYDVVVMRHVLEHINDFRYVLENIYNNALKDNGILFLKLPQIDSKESKIFGKYWHGFDLPRHRVHFTSEGIIKLLNEFGYKSIVIKNEITPYDFVRSFKYGFSDKSMFLKIPSIFQIIVAQIIGYYNYIVYKNAGRMIITAKK